LELLSFARSTFFPTVDFSQFGDLREQLAFCWAHWPANEVPPESVLLIFDDVTDYAAQVKPYLPSDGRFRAIVTTRERLQGIDRLDLNVLDSAAALALLRGIVGDRVETEVETAAAICEWLGFLPLGLELVGYYLQSKPDLSLAEMLERLQDKRIEARSLNPKRLPVNLTAQRGVMAAFELSWEQLDEEAQELAMRLSIFAAAPVPWGLVMGCYGDVDEEDLEEWRDDELVRLHLLDRVSEGRYGLHPLIREFFAVKLAERSEATEWQRSFARVMTAIARQIPQTVTISKQAALKEAIVHLAAATEYSDLLSAENYEYMWPFTGLARFYQAQSLFIEAETYFQQCLDQSETRFGADHPDTANSLNNLALLYQAQGKYESAEPLYQRALDIRERQLGADHPDTATSLNNLAVLYKSQGKYESAEPLFQRALDINERQLGANHPSIANSLNNLAGLYDSQGKYESAEPLNRRALDIRERQLGADHPDTATSLNNLAGLYKSQGKYESAEPLYQRALDIRERQLGADHPDTARSLNNLALLYNSQGKYESAEPLFQRALDIRERQLGADHPSTAQSLNNLAGLYDSQGKYESAEPLYQRALDIRERQLGADHPDTATSLNNLAQLYKSQGKYESAEPLFQRALDIWERQLGANHPDTATSLNNLAGLYQSQGKYESAELLFQRALDIWERQLGANHPSTAASLNNLATLYRVQGKYESAEPLYLRCLAIFENSLGKAHPNTQIVNGNFEKFLQKVIAADRTAELSDHPLTQHLLAQLRTNER
jgi:tetratricopeptide (TPR) repeat protein